MNGWMDEDEVEDEESTVAPYTCLFSRVTLLGTGSIALNALSVVCFCQCTQRDPSISPTLRLFMPPQHLSLLN